MLLETNMKDFILGFLALVVAVVGICVAIVASSSTPTVSVVAEVPATTTTTMATTTTTAAPATTTTTTASQQRAITSTAYCETGLMVTGRPAHVGAVSSRVLPRWSRWRVKSGRFANQVFTVEDTGSLAIFDIALPGRCGEASDYGTRTIYIERV